MSMPDIESASITAKTSSRSRENARAFTYKNRRGDSYYLHQGTTSLGKPKYFTSKNPDGALNAVPSGYEVTEDINGVVFVRRPRASVISKVDLECVASKAKSYRHLAEYQVVANENSIIIYQPLGLDAIDALKPDSFSLKGQFEPMIRSLGRKWDDFLEQIAKQANMSVEEFKKIDRQAAVERNARYVESIKRNMQYRPVMRFVWDKREDKFEVERMSFRGPEDKWISLGLGTIETLSKRFIRHIGKDSFFDLM